MHQTRRTEMEDTIYICDAAAECGDDSLTDYVKDPENGLEGK